MLKKFSAREAKIHIIKKYQETTVFKNTNLTYDS